MPDEELELWRQRKLLEMQRKAILKQAEEERKREQTAKPTEDPETRLRRLFQGRASEVYDAAKTQFPEITAKLTRALGELVSKGELNGPITGEELYSFFRSLGINVRLETQIRFYESGRVRTIADKLREE